MKTKSFLIIMAIIASFITSCSQSQRNDNSLSPPINNYEDVVGAAEELEKYIEEGIQTDDLTSNIDKTSFQELKIIKNAESRFLVKNVDSITQIMIKLAKQYGGYVSNMKFNQDRYQIENNLTLSIPSNFFEEFISKSSKLADYIDYNNITSEDVTEEYVDLKNRIKVKEEVKARYEQILRSNTKTVKEILETERQIQLIQEEIESAKGRLNYINNKSALSTVDVILYQKVSHKDKPEAYSRTFGSKSKNAFKTGWGVIENLAIGLIYIWPLLLILGLTFFFFKRYLRKRKAVNKK